MPGRGKGGGGGGAVSGGVKSMLNTAGKRMRALDLDDPAPPAKRANAGVPTAPPPPAARNDVKKVLTDDELRKQRAAQARRDQKAAKADNPAGSKASGISGGSKPTRLWSTPEAERPTTVNTLGGPARTDKQTTYWAARWLPTSKNPKGLGGGKVPTSVADQAAWVAYQRADRVLYPRQTFTQDVRNETWDRVVGSANSYTDVGGRTVTRDGTWDMGHNPGHEHWSNVRDAFFDGTHPTDFKNDYLDPGNYRPEHPSTNRTHQHEAN